MEGCRGSASSRTNLRVKFSHQHSLDIKVIMEEGNQPQPQFPQREILPPHEALNGAHQTSDICWSGSERNRRRVVVEDTEERIGRVLSEYGTPLTKVPSLN